MTNEGDGRVSCVWREDCAAAAAAVLAGDGDAGRIYDITGAEGLTAAEVAGLFAELAGRPVQVLHVDDETYAAGLVEHAGMPRPVAEVYASFGTGSRRGYSAPVSDTVCGSWAVRPRPCATCSPLPSRHTPERQAGRTGSVGETGSPA